MTSIELDMIQTAGIGALALIVGMVLTRKVGFLQKFCIPSPVSGGIIFSLFTLILYGWFDVEVSFDNTLSDVFMLAFFTSVGYHADPVGCHDCYAEPDAHGNNPTHGG